MKNILGCFFIYFIFGCSDKSEGIYEVSIITLIATPEKMLEKNVMVKGYYGSEGARIYLSKESFANRDYSSSIPVYLDVNNRRNFSRSVCRNNYITVSGRLELIVFEFGTVPVIGLNEVESIFMEEQGAKVNCLENLRAA